VAPRLAAARDKLVADWHQYIAKRWVELYQALVAAGGNI
jgi:hypothetical protein